jgi:hypothetical protein
VVNQHFVDEFLAETGVSVDFDVEEQIWRAAARGLVAYAQPRRASGGGSPKRLLIDFVVAAARSAASRPTHDARSIALQLHVV